MKKQVEATEYAFECYMHLDRWISVHYQISEVLALHPTSVLEVGSGTGTFKRELGHAGVSVRTLDIADDLHPDVLGSVSSIPLSDETFDVVCAFQVLEHLPYENFSSALGEMMRVARKAIVLSLPHYGPNVRLCLKVPGIPEARYAVKIKKPTDHKFDGEHYWEIGKKGYVEKDIRARIERVGYITKDYIPFENRYHHFYVVKK